MDKIKILKQALERIADESVFERCERCDGGGEIYADGKVHYLHEHAPAIDCPDCGGTGEIFNESIPEIAKEALRKVSDDYRNRG